MTGYVDGFVLPMLKKNLGKYLRHLHYLHSCKIECGFARLQMEILAWQWRLYLHFS
jgi:hypothetical protein